MKILFTLIKIGWDKFVEVLTGNYQTFPTYKLPMIRYPSNMSNQTNYSEFSPYILIVDDHERLRVTLQNWLALLFPAWRFQEAASGEEALELATQECPTLVVMDINLPDMDGIEATRRLKTRYPQIMVVMLSIHDEQAYRNAAAQAGADAFVSKSNMYEKLVKVLSGLLSEIIE